MLWRSVPLALALAMTACGRERELAAEADRDATGVLLQVITNQLDAHRARHREFPESLSALVEGKRIRIEQTKDPWGRELRYTTTGRTFELCSDGPDGKPGQDDICRTGGR